MSDERDEDQHAHTFGMPCPVEGCRWPAPEAPNRAARRGNKLHPRSADRRADYRPGMTRPL